MLKRIMDLPAETRRRYDTSSLRAVVCSGSALDAATSRARSWTSSGRCSTTSTARPRCRGRRSPRRRTCSRRRAPSAGRLPHTRVVAPRRERPAAADRRDRAASSSATRCCSRATPTDSASREMVDGMMTAGDLGHLDAEGRLFVDAREDDMIVSGGENVYPGEVEAALRAHPGVGERRGRRRRGRASSASAWSRSSCRRRAATSRRRARPLRAREPGALQGAARDRDHRRAAAQRARQGPAERAAAAEAGPAR